MTTRSAITDQLVDTGLVLGATMRLTRLVVSDDLGAWWVKEPLSAKVDDLILGWPAHRKVRAHGYLDGLDCPYCVGFWIGAGVMASRVLASATGTLGAWRFVAGALTLNEVAAHLGVRVGDFDHEE